MDKRTQPGFTLIELLIVIAIIAILAAILMPVFATAREKARQSSCASNLKQLGLAITQYEQDYDEATPNGNARANTNKGWGGQIYPYVKSVRLYVCPSDTTAGVSSSYFINTDFVNSDIPYTTGIGQMISSWTLSKFGAPARTVMLGEVQGSAGYDIANPDMTNSLSDKYAPSPTAESGYTANGTGCANNWDPWTTSFGAMNVPCGKITGGACGAASYTLKYATGYPYNMAACSSVGYASPTGRHSDGSNYLMADCHCKWFKGTQVFAGSNNKTVGDCSSSTSTTAMNTGCGLTGVAVTYSVF